MPNHIHGIIIIRTGVLQYARTYGFHSPSQTLGTIIRGLKSATTKRINILRKTHGKPIWQRSYYNHVIRNDHNLSTIREYINNNQKNWAIDKYNVS